MLVAKTEGWSKGKFGGLRGGFGSYAAFMNCALSRGTSCLAHLIFREYVPMALVDSGTYVRALDDGKIYERTAVSRETGRFSIPLRS